jgi:hypothetical protein
MTMRIERIQSSREMPLLKATATDENVPNFVLFWMGYDLPVHVHYLDTVFPSKYGNSEHLDFQGFCDYAETFFMFIDSIAGERQAA